MCIHKKEEILICFKETMKIKNKNLIKDVKKSKKNKRIEEIADHIMDKYSYAFKKLSKT